MPWEEASSPLVFSRCVLRLARVVLVIHFGSLGTWVNTLCLLVGAQTLGRLGSFGPTAGGTSVTISAEDQQVLQ